MAAIARFISYDGGIAFSENALKLQRRDEEQGRIIPVSEIAAMEVSEPLFGDDGCISFRLVRERKVSKNNVLYFDEEQYAEAVQFKVAFDTLKAQSRVALPPLEMFQPTALVHAKRAVPPQPVRPQQPRRRPVRRPEVWPDRDERPRPRRKSKLKKILVGVIGGYAALLAIGGLALLFGNEPADDAAAGNAHAVLSDTWQPPETATPAPTVTAAPTPQVTATPAPDADLFLEQARSAASGLAGEGTQIKNISLVDRDLQISVDYSDPAYLSNYDDNLLLASSDKITEPILALGAQYDTLWDSMTVDYGDYGKVVKNKSDVISQPSENSGPYTRRYFVSANETVVHSVPVPRTEVSVPAVVSAGTYGAIAAGQGTGYTSPPRPTDPPVTAPPSQQSEPLVWIPTKGGQRYHRTNTCSGMNGPIQVTVSEAERRNFTPCKKCY